MAEESEAGEGNERCTSSAAAIVVCSHLERPRVVGIFGTGGFLAVGRLLAGPVVAKPDGGGVVVTVVGRLATTVLVSAL